MGRILFAFLATACIRGGAFECTSNAQCGTAGLCEATTGFCSFADTSCPGGRRYGDYAGNSLGGECVGGMSGGDGGSDARIDVDADARADGGGGGDGTNCTFPFVTTNVDPCDSALPAPLGALVLDVGGAYHLNTDSGELRDPGNNPVSIASVVIAQTDAPSLRVVRVDGFSINVGSRLIAFGSNALVFVSTGDVAIRGVLDVSGGDDEGGDPQPGPGAQHTAACASSAGSGGNDGFDGGGGGGGGAYGAGGGDGGGGGDVGQNPGGVGGSPSGSDTLSPLRGGCAGGHGGDGIPGGGGEGGTGGGALQIISDGMILVESTRIDAGGGHGHKGFGGGGGSGIGGGAGGGSGGAILLEALRVTLDDAGVCANGASGGEGGQSIDDGAQGADGTCSETDTATTPDTSEAGDGGSGGYRGGGAGGGTDGQVYSGGGGGGGSVGRIRLRGVMDLTVDSASDVSPASP